MRNFQLKFFFLLVVYFPMQILFSSVMGQSTTLNGIIIGEKQRPISEATIYIQELDRGTISNEQGLFYFNDINLNQDIFHVHISHTGYECIHQYIENLDYSDSLLVFQMFPKDISLDGVTIVGNKIEKKKKEATTSIAIIDDKFIRNNTKSSLMKSLESIAGVSSLEVGQGFAKPIIRGLGFNRVAVTENGIKQEGQQWGTDHGLEIDQFGIENIEIIKGPASLLYGSDAIGGVIQIKPNTLPPTHTIHSSVDFIGKTLNDLLGFSTMIKYRNNKWNYYARYTQLDFADYKVPAKDFVYNQYRMPIYNHRLKNTAGKEKDLYFTTGYIHKNFRSTINISNVYSKVGFFPGSHGIPDASKLLHDGDYRNIDFPFQQVNHFKVSHLSKFYMHQNMLEINLAYQNNIREEKSTFHTHYPNQSPPLNNPNLELGFVLHTLSASALYQRKLEQSTFSVTINSQYQKNDISGYMFLLPNYKRTSSGIGIHEKINLTSNLTITGGVRFDYGKINIDEYFSPFTQQYKSHDYERDYHDFSWAVGATYDMSEKLNIKTNIGKSFRMPHVSELSANGIHHGSFRYEVGDKNITSEYAYQIDMGLYYNDFKLDIEVNPFFNYFPNYIYMNPTGSYLHPEGYEIVEADAGQVYQYIQSKAYRSGIDYAINTNVTNHLKAILSGEYVYATDLTYPIPFTPPFNTYLSLAYTYPLIGRKLRDNTLTFTSSYFAEQNRNARNELPTPDYYLFDVSLSSEIIIHSNMNVMINFQIQNIFNRKYYNHMSFYRLISLPEAGRNFQIMIKIPFKYYLGDNK